MDSRQSPTGRNLGNSAYLQVLCRPSLITFNLSYNPSFKFIIWLSQYCFEKSNLHLQSSVSTIQNSLLSSPDPGYRSQIIGLSSSGPYSPVLENDLGHWLYMSQSMFLDHALGKQPRSYNIIHGCCNGVLN